MVLGTANASARLGIGFFLGRKVPFKHIMLLGLSALANYISVWTFKVVPNEYSANEFGNKIGALGF